MNRLRVSCVVPVGIGIVIVFALAACHRAQSINPSPFAAVPGYGTPSEAGALHGQEVATADVRSIRRHLSAMTTLAAPQAHGYALIPEQASYRTRAGCKCRHQRRAATRLGPGPRDR